MSRTATFGRLGTALCLVLYAVLGVTFVTTAPVADPTSTTYLADVAAAGSAAVVSAYAFLGAQLALTIGVIGLAGTLRGRAPVLAYTAAALLIVGAFAHAAHSGVSLAVIGMASAPPAAGAGATDAVAAAQAGPLIGISLLGVAGLVFGTILLAATMFRARLGAWWIGVALLLWVVAEFALSGLGTWAVLTSGGLLLAAFGGLAALVLRSDLGLWMPAGKAGAAEPTPIAVPAPAG
ncbi:hypothetical protein [Occultella kanbiaonis]|uniref:hypothetical protein n=1 Tax=Occultella kanbiaonis TaxID=2675754 RepID=UPI0013D24B33|nr:hypothetical protein [Occultella kanbiaonis]